VVERHADVLKQHVEPVQRQADPLAFRKHTLLGGGIVPGTGRHLLQVQRDPSFQFQLVIGQKTGGEEKIKSPWAPFFCMTQGTW